MPQTTIRNQQDSRAFMPVCVLCVYKAATTYWHLIPYLLSLVSHYTARHGMSNKHVIITIVLNENIIKSQLLKKCLFSVTLGFDIESYIFYQFTCSELQKYAEIISCIFKFQENKRFIFGSISAWELFNLTDLKNYIDI